MTNVIPFGRKMTEADYWQHIYKIFDDISQDLGSDHVPHEVFPLIIRMMVEWVEAIRGMGSDLDLETAKCLAECIRALAECQARCIASTDTG